MRTSSVFHDETRRIRRCDKITRDQLNVPEKGITLLKRPKKFQSKEPHITGSILAQYLGGNGRSFTGDHTGLGWGGRGNGQMNDLVWAQNVGRCDTGTHGTSVQRLGELDEFHA